MDHTPIFMLNVLWFHPNGGAERYREYLKAVWPTARKYGGEKLDAYVPEAAVIGELDADLLSMVRCTDQDWFEEFIADLELHAVVLFSAAARTKSLLIRCRSADG